jgi:hypothetical protein
MDVGQHPDALDQDDRGEYGRKCIAFAAPSEALQVTTIVVAMTAMPPPCGVGILCDEQVLGRARAWR